MKHFDIHNFATSFEEIQWVSVENRKSLLRQAVIYEAEYQYREHQEVTKTPHFIISWLLFMKNIKLISVTAIIALVAIISSIFAPSVMAQITINNWLSYLEVASPAMLEKEGYTKININFEWSLKEAKNAKDLRIISEEKAIDFLTAEKLPMDVVSIRVPDKDTSEASQNVAVNKEVWIATAEDVRYLKDKKVAWYQRDSRIVKYLSYTNPAGKKVVLGIDKNNLPIIMQISNHN